LSEDCKFSDPKPVGKFISHEDIDLKVETVESKSKKLGWTCCIRDGWEVKIVTEEFEKRLAVLNDDKDKLELIYSLDNMTELHQGQKVLVMSITGWCFGTVMLRSRYLSSPHVENRGSVWPLKEAEDERECWVTSSQINKRCFDMVWEDIEKQEDSKL
jgi:hypothetical protein